MYSVLMMAAFTTAPQIPDSRAERVARRASAGCHGAQAVQYVAVAASGCSGSFASAPAAGCAGSVQGRSIAPLRHALARHDARVASRVNARAARRSGETTSYHALAAVPVTVASTYPVPQSAAPPHCPVAPGAAKP